MGRHFDLDGRIAKKTRRALCQRYADAVTPVFGTHFAAPSADKMVKKRIRSASSQ
jgi:hypothetical protein